MLQQKITEIILYEPRPLFRNAAKNSIQAVNGSLLVIEPDALIEEVTSLLIKRLYSLQALVVPVKKYILYYG
jgi:hypothetical protein